MSNLFFAQGASSGQIVIEASHEVEIRLVATESAVPVCPANRHTLAPDASVYDLDAILQRLQKLRSGKRAAAVNSIKAIFQFKVPMNDEAANRLVEELRKRGSLSIDATDKVQLRNA